MLSSSSVLSQFSKFASLNIKPLGTRVVIELEKSIKEKVGNLYVPESAQQKTNQGTIRAIGTGRVYKGKNIPMVVSVGQKVLLPQFGGQVVKIGKEEYTVISEEDILAVFE